MGQARKILAVSYRLPPMLTPRAIQVHRLLSHWASAGHEVHAICASPETAPCPESDPGLMDLYPDRYRVHHVPSPEAAQRDWFLKFYPNRDWRRRAALKLWSQFLCVPDPQLFWVRRAAVEACRLIRLNRIDGMITFGNPMSDHLVGLAAKRRTGIRWLAHFSDPWVDSPYKTYSTQARVVNCRQERQVVGAADHALFVSDETRDRVMSKYPAPWRSRSRVIPHYYDPKVLPAADPPATEITFRHIGTFYGPRTPEPLFKALSLLKQSSPGTLSGTRFELVGPTYPPRMMDTWLSSHDLADLVFCVPPVPYQESLRLMSTAHVLVTIDAPSVGPSIFLPCKLVDYLGAGRPLLGITSAQGASAEFIRKANGLVAAPDDVQGIAATIETLISEARAGVLSQRRTPDDALRSAYTVETAAQQFEKLLGTPCAGGAE